MNGFISKVGALAPALLLSTTAVAGNDFGVGVKAGTLGLGIEGVWRPLPYMDIRFGVNRYDYDDDGSKAGINYEATLNLDSQYASANFRFPLTPFRVTAGLYSNGNAFNLSSKDDLLYEIGDTTYTSAQVGTLSSTTTFGSTAPYVGIGYDFSVLGKVGLNLDLGLLWQGRPDVTLSSDGPFSGDPDFQAAMEAERQQLVEEFDKAKAWPVLSLGFVVNF